MTRLIGRVVVDLKPEIHSVGRFITNEKVGKQTVANYDFTLTGIKAESLGADKLPSQ